MESELTKLFREINELIGAFQVDGGKCVAKGNKAAGRRARVCSVELAAKLKEFRKISPK